MDNTWIVLLRNTNPAVPDFKVFAHNLTRDAAKSLEEDIRQQRVEGERVTLVYLMNGGETHEECEPDECCACHEMILAAHRQELQALEQEMRRRRGARQARTGTGQEDQ
jgi:hypothetical protein